MHHKHRHPAHENITDNIAHIANIPESGRNVEKSCPPCHPRAHYRDTFCRGEFVARRNRKRKITSILTDVVKP
ncbi:hypothetical protein ACOMHN_013982 [Nucella lapillus]